MGSAARRADGCLAGEECGSKEQVDELWVTLSAGGAALMALESSPFSERDGWTEDRYGLSRQVMCVDDGNIQQRITPTLMFVGAGTRV